jgi:aconitase B
MIRLDHFLLRSEKVDLGFVGSCMVQRRFKILSKMLQNIDEQYGKVESLKHSCGCASNLYIVDEEQKEMGSFTKIFWF